MKTLARVCFLGLMTLPLLGVSIDPETSPVGLNGAWNLMPGVVKAPVAVSIGARNPFQPAVVSSTLPFINLDEVSLKLRAAIDGKIASVVRGNYPAIMSGGRLFRIGDEFVDFVPAPNGGGLRKQSFLQGHRVILKAILSDSLRFQVESLDPLKPNVMESVYRLDPAFSAK